MIPQALITEWRSQVPWAEDAQVEQDLIISGVLLEIFGEEAATKGIVFRGGTALNKLFLQSPSRYSEDIDLVQVEKGPIGPVINPIRNRLKSLFEQSTFKTKENSVQLLFRFSSEIPPVTQLRLKVEVNTREHFSVFPIESRPFSMDSRWMRGRVEIPTYHIDELMGTKMRALYQRKKGRDLFDLWEVLERGLVSPDRVVECFLSYLDSQGLRVSRAEYEANLTGKIGDRGFAEDTQPLLASGSTFDLDGAFSLVMDTLVSRLPGEPWRGIEGGPGP